MCDRLIGPVGHVDGIGSQKAPATGAKAAKERARSQARYQTIEPPRENPVAHSRARSTG
jgi:hypothetical protein